MQEQKLDDSSHLDVVEIARVPDMLPGLFPSWSGCRLISTPVVRLTATIVALFSTMNYVLREFARRESITK
jgi:hypothetical protein